MTQLSKGANLALHATSVRAVLFWNPAPGAPDVDASALLVGPTGKVRSPEDFVHLGHLTHPSGAVRHEGEQVSAGIAGAGLTIDLAALDPSVEKVVLTASTEAVFGAVQGLQLRLFDLSDGQAAASFAITDAASETALVTGELYRHGGGWKFRAIGQGYASGMDGLAADYGITTPQSTRPDPFAGAPPTTPQPYPAPPTAPQPLQPQAYPAPPQPGQHRPTAPYPPSSPPPQPGGPTAYPPTSPPPGSPAPGGPAPGGPPPYQPGSPPPPAPYPPSRPTAPYPPGRPDQPY
ncbi:MAG: TerD family protein [Streptosporangiaceae bacterium]